MGFWRLQHINIEYREAQQLFGAHMIGGTCAASKYTQSQGPSAVMLHHCGSTVDVGKCTCGGDTEKGSVMADRQVVRIGGGES
jgi:hypothetical protein